MASILPLSPQSLKYLQSGLTEKKKKFANPNKNQGEALIPSEQRCQEESNALGALSRHSGQESTGIQVTK